jgi:hypothetical protein
MSPTSYFFFVCLFCLTVIGGAWLPSVASAQGLTPAEEQRAINSINQSPVGDLGPGSAASQNLTTTPPGAGGLVPCNGPDCNACHLVALANNVFNFIITLAVIIGTIGLIVAGLGMVTSGGNTESWARAKRIFGNVIIGFIIILAAWLIVDTVLQALTGEGLEAWTEIQCSA